MRLLNLLVLAVALFLSGDVAKDKNLCHIIASNPIQIPITSNTGIDQSTFDNILAEFTKVYSPIVAKKGYTLVLRNKWADNTVNSDTTVSGTKWVINAYGGLARYPSMDADAYMMVLCHEIGHHLAGYPNQGWASNEGQSDYYATSKCFSRMSYSRYIIGDVPAIVSQKCSLLHKSQEEINLCAKASIVGGVLANVLKELGNEKSIDFNTPDKTEVKSTNNDHPKAQCRMDTYFAGAVCNASYLDDFSSDNPIQGACAEEKGDKVGVRPHCWYKPKL